RHKQQEEKQRYFRRTLPFHDKEDTTEERRSALQRVGGNCNEFAAEPCMTACGVSVSAVFYSRTAPDSRTEHTEQVTNSEDQNDTVIPRSAAMLLPRQTFHCGAGDLLFLRVV